MATYYTYMVLCSDGSLYTLVIRNLVRRMGKHNSGKGAKYTRSRLPVQLVYWEKFSGKRQACSENMPSSNGIENKNCSYCPKNSELIPLLFREKRKNSEKIMFAMEQWFYLQNKVRFIYGKINCNRWE